MANSAVDERLATLPTLRKSQLCDLWKQLFNNAPPAHLRKESMVPILAYRIQEHAYGSLSAKSIQHLRKLAAALATDPNAANIAGPRIKPGTRLVRQWGDQVHVVEVEENDYESKGSHYRSLSEIARLITGTRWSGPLFFGLKTKVHGEAR